MRPFHTELLRSQPPLPAWSRVGPGYGPRFARARQADAVAATPELLLFALAQLDARLSRIHPAAPSERAA